MLADSVLIGSQALTRGMVRGVMGLFRSPQLGWQTAGVSGACMGVGQGVAGLVLQPASGLLECVACTLTGLANQVCLAGTAKRSFQGIRR